MSELHVVTGGAGFIGSHLVEALLREGRRVRVVDDFSTGKRSRVPPAAELMEGDAAALAARAVEGAAVVHHLAAMPSVPRSVEDPQASHHATTETLLAVLAAAERARVRRVVFTSSCAVYGDSPVLPRREDQPPRPLSPYAAAKLAGELYARSWAVHTRLETVSLRLFNVYGPRQDPDSPYAAVVPIFLGRLRKGRPLPVFGDGKQLRDFVYIRDVVRAIMESGTSGVSGSVYNIAAGRGVSVMDLGRAAARVAGSSAEFELFPPRPGDIRDSWADVSAAARDLGFAAETPLETGLRMTWENSIS